MVEQTGAWSVWAVLAHSLCIASIALNPGQLQVLSNHFSKGVTAAYIEAQKDADWKVKVLEFAEDEAAHCTTKFREDARKSVTAFLKRYCLTSTKFQH